MQDNPLKQKRDGLLAGFFYRKKWRRITTILSVFVVICTVASLMLPAITLNQYICGYDEHFHAANCYATHSEKTLTCTHAGLVVHSHDSACYSDDGSLLCLLAEVKEHQHDENCYQTPQIITDIGHSHSDACYDWVMCEAPSCGLEESSEHIHEDGCFACIQGALICTDAEREPVISEGEPILLCEKKQIILHSHSGTCYEYDTDGNVISLICTKPEIAAHQHTDLCFTDTQIHTLTCQLPEHIHSDSCRKPVVFTEEEQLQVDSLISSIEALPSSEEVNAQLASFEETGDMDGQCAYRASVSAQLIPLFNQYDGLNADQKDAITNAEKLMAMEYLLPEEPPALTAEEQTQLDSAINSIRSLPNPQVLLSELDAFAAARNLTGWEETFHAAEARVQSARAEYAALAEHLQPYVSNIALLEELEKSLTEAQAPLPTAEEQNQLDSVVARIHELPDQQTVQHMIAENADDPALLELLSHIASIREDYTQMNDLQKHFVSNLDKLEQIEAALTPLQLTDEELQEAADVVIMIDNLPPVSQIQQEITRLQSAEEREGLKAYQEKIHTAVKAAFESYNALSLHQQALVSNAALLEQYRHLLFKEETLCFTGEGFNLTIVCPSDAQIPENATVSVSRLDTGSDEYAQHMALAGDHLPGYTVLDARFFDIAIHLDGQKIQPKADVTLTVEFETPMAAKVNDYIKVIHYGSNNMQLIDGTVHWNNGQITGITFHQDSFSVSGVIISEPAIVNTQDIGPDSLNVDYYVHINGTWEKVGTTTTGWDAAYHGRDYITEAQVASILGKYGFQSTGDSARSVYYQPSNNDFQSMVWSDTSTVEYAGQRIIPLSDGIGWRLFFAPDSTYNGNAANPGDILNKTSSNIRFYSVDVQDPQKIVFESSSQWNAYRVIFRSGDNPTITLPKPPSGSWSFYHDGGEKNNDLRFSDNGDGTVSCTVHNLGQHLRAIPDGTYDFGPDKMTVHYLVFLDGQWHVVGETKYGWRGNYGLADLNNMDCRDQISLDQIYSILWRYGFSISDAANARKLIYQQKGQDACYSDTNLDQTGDHVMFPMSQNGNGDGYNVYFVPNNTQQIKGVPGSALPAETNRFWSITVVDPNGYVYKRTDTYDELSEVNTMSAYVLGTNQWHHFASVAKDGTKGSVTVRRAGWAWRWRDGVDNFPYRDQQELYWTTDGDHITVTTNENMTKQLWLDAYDNSLRMDAAGPQTGDIQTVSGQGITFKLFNYRADINEVFYQRGLLSGPLVRDEADYYNSTNYFAFRDLESPWKLETLSSKYDRDGYWFYSNQDPDHATVMRNLVNGMPVLDLTHRGNVAQPSGVTDRSLSILFKGDGSGGYVHEYSCVNTPLRYDASDGYYKYDSAKNAADFDTVSRTWYIRNRVERGYSTAENYPGYADYFPFNNGDGHVQGSAGNGMPYQYKMLDVDYWFGMTMSVNFFQGKDGCIEYGGATAPMEFHFSGDDDVWVFLDDMLVLDIGGTHGAVDGFINFNTGLVTTAYNFGPAAGNDPNWAKSGHSSATTIYECFEAALKDQGLSESQVSARLDEIFVSTSETVTDNYTGKTFPVYRFKDYSSHKMNFFYLERGGGSSNCAISFNLPTLPDETLFVGKELAFDDSTLTAEQIAFARDNLFYRFRVVDENENPIFKSTTVDVLDDSLKNVVGTTTLDADGWFSLKAGQRVKFEHMLQTLQELNLQRLEYYVQEAIPSTLVGQYNGVAYKDGGTSGEITIDGQSSADWVIYKTGALSPENTYTVIYTNKVDVEKMSFLQLRKEIAPGSVSAGSESFNVVVTIGGKSVAAGTRFHYTDNNQEITASEGGIVQLQIGRTLQMTSPVMAGTAFSVREHVPEGWSLVGYTTQFGNVTEGSVTGNIPLDKTVTITITNRTNAFSLEIPVTKEFRGGKSDVLRSATFHAEQVTDKNGVVTASQPLYPTQIRDIEIICDTSNPVTGKFQLEFQENTPPGTYYYRISETGFTAGESESFLKDSTSYVVQVQVTSNAASVSAVYINDVQQHDNAILFVNQYAAVALPDAGSTGTHLYTLSGWAILAACCLFLLRNRRMSAN